MQLLIQKTIQTGAFLALSGLCLSCEQGSNQPIADSKAVETGKKQGSPLAESIQTGTPFKTWIHQCRTLPANRTLGGQLPEKKALPMQDLVEFNRVLDRFLELQLTGPLSEKDHWVGKTPSKDTFFNTSKVYFEQGGIPFEPFAQKLELGAESKVLVHGDLHGDIHSLNAWLEHLNQVGQLDGFKITHPSTHLMFLGDYTDRGAYGVEVMYVLLRLRVENPSQVWMARGNHEDIRLTMNYGFLREATSKYGPEFPIKRLSRIYDFLPVVIYLGHAHNFIQCNHGGVEPGYKPSKLLDHSTQFAFQFIGQVKQRTFLEENNGIEAILGSTSNKLARERFSDFTPTSPTTPTILGFMWNDFSLTKGESPLSYNPGRAWIYGDTLTRLALRKASSAENQIRAIFRAHQHFSMPHPMMHRLIHGKGVFRHWQEERPPSPNEKASSLEGSGLEVGRKRTLVNGAAYTFNVAPDSTYGAGNHYDFDTFGILRVAPTFDAWELEVVNLTHIKW